MSHAPDRARVQVDQLMTPSPVTVRVGEPLRVAAERMEELDVRHLPVVDGPGRVVGVLSDRDLRRWSGTGAPDALVDDVMTRDVLSVRPETLAHEAVGLMLDRRVGGLPVIDDEDRLVGILTETDLVRLAYRFLGGQL